MGHAAREEDKERGEGGLLFYLRVWKHDDTGGYDPVQLFLNCLSSVKDKRAHRLVREKVEFRFIKYLDHPGRVTLKTENLKKINCLSS